MALRRARRNRKTRHRAPHFSQRRCAQAPSGSVPSARLQAL
ncbi:hypothetical protein [Duodenibacillus massiliensis]